MICFARRSNLSSLEVRPRRHIACLRVVPLESQTSAPLVILIHGACARMQQLVNQVRFLGKLGYEVVSYDSLGCGMSDKPHDSRAYSSEEMYADFIEFVEFHTLRAGRRAKAIIGHSMGGAMVLKYAAEDPSASNATERVVSIAPPFFGQPKLTTGVFQLPRPVLWLIRPLMGMKVREMLFGPNPAPLLVRQEKEASARNPVHMFKSFYMGINPKMLSLTTTKLQVPALVLSAEFDRICPPFVVEAYYTHFKEDETNAVFLQQVAGAGHQCMQEDPGQVNEILQKFLATKSP